MSYRIEISSSNRAGCKATHCNKEKIKIAKGEIRQGVLITTPDFQSWAWRHWGCVTPVVLHNWWETANHDLDLVDGFDELPEEVQQKVRKALEQEHVEDDEWNGDIECNRYDPNKKSQGMFLKGAALKQKQAAEAGEEVEESPKKTKSKKRSAGEDNEAEEKPSKKSKTKEAPTAFKDEDSDDTQSKPVKKSKAKSKKAVAKDEEADDIDEKPTKKSKAKSKASTTAADVKDDAAVDVEEKPTKKSKAKPKAAITAKNEEADDIDEKPAKKSKAKPKKLVPVDSADDEVLAVQDKNDKPAKKSRAKATKADSDTIEEPTEPAPQKKSRAKKTKSTEAAEAPKPKTSRRKKSTQNDE